MEILALLLLFQIKHWYADFKIQTYMQTVKKGVPAFTIIAVAVLEGFYHYLIDYTKVKYGCKDNTKPLFWNQFGLDQLAHQTSYLVIAWYILL